MIRKLSALVKRLLASLDDLLFPEDVLCLCCARALGEDAYGSICPDCAQQLDMEQAAQEAAEAEMRFALPEGIGYVHAAYAYAGYARKLVRLLKYHGVRAAAQPLAREMALLPSGEEEIIVPVPTDPARLRRRGYNQAQVLAECIGKELGMQVVPALVRVKKRPSQTGLSGRERLTNLVGCMEVSHAAGEAVNGKQILLIDDVYTTGATAGEAARALLEAGAAGVSMFAATRAMHGSDEKRDPFEPVRMRRKAEKTP